MSHIKPKTKYSIKLVSPALIIQGPLWLPQTRNPNYVQKRVLLKHKDMSWGTYCCNFFWFNVSSLYIVTTTMAVANHVPKKKNVSLLFIKYWRLLLYCFLTCIASPPFLLKGKNLCCFPLRRTFDECIFMCYSFWLDVNATTEVEEYKCIIMVLFMWRVCQFGPPLLFIVIGNSK